MATVLATRQKIICHCLRVTEEELQRAIDAGTVRSVKDAMDVTGAGSGCTACHCTIREMLLRQGNRLGQSDVGLPDSA